MIANFIDGPLWYFSSIVFVLGVLARIVSILRCGVKEDLSPPRGGGVCTAARRLWFRDRPG